MFRRPPQDEIEVGEIIEHELLLRHKFPVGAGHTWTTGGQSILSSVMTRCRSVRPSQRA